VSRYRIRRLAVSLVTCDPWPGLAATDQDAAQLALLRLRWLPSETRRAVAGTRLCCPSQRQIWVIGAPSLPLASVA
jgi:hypothetical protein